MPTFIPKFKLYDSSLNFIMDLPAISYTNAPQTNIKNTVIEGIRGEGCVVVEGSEGSWDLIVRGVVLAANYESIVTLMDTLETNIPKGTKLYLKLEKSIAQTYTYKVRRLVPIEYPESLRTNYQEFQITFKANAW
jgi:hypothetical protein